MTENLSRAGETDLEAIMQAVKDEFVKWYHFPENPRAPGRTCLTGADNMEKGIPWSKSGMADSKGCGSAMRAAPLYFSTYSAWTDKVITSGSLDGLQGLRT